MARLLKSPQLLRLYRAGVLIIVVLLIHQQARWFESQRAAPISLRQARKFFPNANKVQLRDAERSVYIVTDSRGNNIGCLLTTSPQTDNIIGYSGPNNLLIALDARGAIAGLELLNSGDTAEHVSRVKRDPNFFSTFIGWRPSETPAPKIQGVSGATLTSFAIAESVQQRLAGASPSLRFPDPVSLDEVKSLFTNATHIVREDSRLRVLGAAGSLLGFAVRTSPQADNISGYRGPSECLVAVAPDGRTITGLRIRKSYDTDSYVDQIRRAEHFLKLFVGRTVEELAAFNYPKERIEGVAGATRTAQAVAEGMQRRFAAELNIQRKPPPWRPKPRDWALAATIIAAIAISFSSLRGNRWLRLTWQLFLIGYIGFVNHDLLSLALFGGWASNGLALKAAPALVLLGAAALFLPWITRRQVYCHQICPHGAAQQLLGKVFHRRWTPPQQVTRVLEFAPALLLLFALLTLLVGWSIDLATIEGFDAWVWQTAGIATICIAGVGLAASLFIPQAYCRFGCPTGALLNFVRSTGSSDRWGRRDWAALSFVAAGAMTVIAVRAWPRVEAEPEPTLFHGLTMGTTWSVKIRDEVGDAEDLKKAIATEFDVAEALTSHWRTNTSVSQFNRTLDTNAMPVPWPVLTLAKWSAEISRATDGAFDITVGPLVRLWGFGPGPRRTEPPSDSELAAILPAIGWEKLHVLDGMLRKEHPAVEVDFSAIVPGWAIDQVAHVLEYRGFTNFLVESGGELRARGRWNIAIEHPTRTCILTNESIGTSGTYRQKYKAGGRQYSHLIDPHTGRPIAHNTVSVSVRHTDCAHADAWAAALNVLGVEAGLPLAERLNLAAQFVVEKGEDKFEVRQSSAWKQKEALAAPTPEQKR